MSAAAQIISGETLADAIASLGFTPPHNISPGRWVKFSTSGRAKDDAGRCKLFADGNGGIIFDYRSNEKWLWFADAGQERQYTAADRAKREREIEQAKREQEAAEAKQHAKAAGLASRLLEAAAPAGADHPYLARKQVPPAGLFEMPVDAVARVIGYQPKAKAEPLAGRILLAPVVIGGELSTVELIDEAGKKAALFGGRKAGAWWTAGLPESDGTGCTIAIAEGIATAATVAALTGWHAVAALSCGNLKAVATALRARFPAARLVVVSDVGNGEADARKAALAADAGLLVPVIPAGFDGTDFNDLAALDRDEARRQLLGEAARPEPEAADPLDDALRTKPQAKPGLLDCAAHFPPQDMSADVASIGLRQALVEYLDAFELALKVRKRFTADMEVATEAAKEKAAADAARLVEAVWTDLGDDATDDEINLELCRRVKLKPSADDEADMQSRIERVLFARAKRAAHRRLMAEACAAHGVEKLPNLPRLQLKAAAGLGKTSLVVQELAKREWLRTNAFIEIYVPRHELADEIAAKIPGARIMRGRGWPSRDESWCERYATTEKLAQAGLPVFENACMNSNGRSHCYENCAAVGWVAQWLNHTPGVRIMTHNFVVLPKPLGTPKPDLVIIDETCVSHATGHYEFSPCRITTSVMKHSMAASLAYRATATKVLDALSDNGRELAKARVLGLTTDELRAAARFIEDEDAPVIGPQLSDSDIEKRVDDWNQTEGVKLAKMYRALSWELDFERDGAHGVELRRNVSRTVTKTENGKKIKSTERQDRIFVHYRKDVHIPSEAALLLIDADASIEINRKLFGANLQEQVFRVRRNAYVVQVWSNTFSKHSLDCKSRRAEQTFTQIRAVLAMEAADGKRVLCITSKSVRCLLTGEMPEADLAKTGKCGSISVAHFGNIRGGDGWKDFDTVIIIGRNQPPLYAVEETARALWSDAVEPLRLLTGGPESDGEKAAWQKAPRGYTMADGSRCGVLADLHPDARVQLILELSRETETVQAIDRLRLLHRETAGRVVVLCSLPVDIVVDELVDWPTLHGRTEKTLPERMLETGAAVCEPWDLMAVAHDTLFKTGDAARMAFGRLNPNKSAYSILMRFCSDLAPATFRLGRDGKRAVTGTVLHRPGVDVAAWLAEHLPGAKLVADGQAEAAAEPPAPDAAEPKAADDTQSARAERPAPAEAPPCRTVVENGITVWVTPDGRRWLREPTAADMVARRPIIFDTTEPARFEPSAMFKAGADIALDPGFTGGGRAILANRRPIIGGLPRGLPFRLAPTPEQVAVRQARWEAAYRESADFDARHAAWEAANGNDDEWPADKLSNVRSIGEDIPFQPPVTGSGAPTIEPVVACGVGTVSETVARGLSASLSGGATVSATMSAEPPRPPVPDIEPDDISRVSWVGSVAFIGGVEVGQIGKAGLFVPRAQYFADDDWWPMRRSAGRWQAWTPESGVGAVVVA